MIPMKVCWGIYAKLSCHVLEHHSVSKSIIRHWKTICVSHEKYHGCDAVSMTFEFFTRCYISAELSKYVVRSEQTSLRWNVTLSEMFAKCFLRNFWRYLFIIIHRNVFQSMCWIAYRSSGSICIDKCNKFAETRRCSFIISTFIN